jgi:hypothetical protein
LNIEADEFQLNGLMANLKEEHGKFLTTLSHRSNCLKVIHKWWSVGNVRACINAIDHHEDISVVNDCLTLMKHSIDQIPKQHATSIIKACERLIGSKYSSHV